MSKKRKKTVLTIMLTMVLTLLVLLVVAFINRREVTPKTVNSAFLEENSDSLKTATSSILFDFGEIKTK